MAEPPDDTSIRFDPKEQFAALAATFSREPGVSLPHESGGRGFGSDALKVNGSIFAMLTRGRIVVKLPRERVAALIGEGSGGPFDAGKGTPMKEWLTVMSMDQATWEALAREALDFVGRRT